MAIASVDASLPVERRASPPGWTGETPVPPPYDSSRGHGLFLNFERVAQASQLRIKDQKHKTVLLQPQTVMPRYDRTDRERDRRYYDPVINRSAKIIFFQRDQPVFGQLHPSRLSVSYDHVHLRFQSPQLLQNFVLEVASAQANHHRQL